ncbi:MAG: glutathione peroxidase [Myxococcota bacterium]
MTITDIAMTQLNGQPLDPDTLKEKVVLVVNVASRCGFTSQYKGLQALYEKHADDGVVVLGVPCNQFGSQEPGTAEEIATFCETRYNVTFPMLDKQDVNGPGRSPLYQFLIGDTKTDVRWNFEKFVVGRDGEVKARFSSRAAPDSTELNQAIAAEL